MKTIQTQPTYPNTPDFDQVWAALEETDQMVKELDETQRETARITVKNAELIGKLGRHFTDMAERTVIRLY